MTDDEQPALMAVTLRVPRPAGTTVRSGHGSADEAWVREAGQRSPGAFHTTKVKTNDRTSWLS
jgi:hypothetical protein